MKVASLRPPPKLKVLRSNVAEKLPDVPGGNPENGTTTGAAVPGGWQQWMCAALAGVVNPENVSFTVRMSPLSVTTAFPVAVDAFGGVSDEPFITAMNVKVSAKHLVPAPHDRSMVPIARAVRTLNISTSLSAALLLANRRLLTKACCHRLFNSDNMPYVFEAT